MTSGEEAGGPRPPFRRSGRPPTRAGVNAALGRLGMPVELSEEAVAQLARAAEATEEYLRRHPEQAEALRGDPPRLLRALTEEGLLEGPLPELEQVVEEVRRQREAQSGG